MKWIGRISLVGILVLIIVGGVAYCGVRGTEPPSKEDAPYALQSYYDTGGLKVPNRVYYAESIEIKSGQAILTNYWSYDGKRYHKRSGTKAINPPFDIIRRFKNE